MQIGRKYLQEKRIELPETVGRTTLFVKQILEKSGQGEAFVFDAASLVYLQPAAQEEEAEKAPEEERARDYVLREKETMQLITREEKSREFFTNIIRTNVLPGAVRMLREKSWRKQLSSQLQVLLREYRELEHRQQVFFDSWEVLEIQTEKQDVYQAWLEFRKELAVLESQVENWQQETDISTKEEHLRRRLEEQVERLFVCRQVLEEQEEEWLSGVEKQLDEVILKVLDEQPELAPPQGKTMHTAGNPVQTEGQPNQSAGELIQTAELLHRIRRDVLEKAVESKEVFAARIHQESQRESQIYRLVLNKLQELTKEEAVEIGRELLEKRKLAQSNAEYKEYQSVQTDRKEKLDEVILKVLEEQVGLATLQGKTMQTVGGPVQTAELLHRIRRDVWEQAVESKEVSTDQMQQEEQKESQIYKFIQRKLQELTKEEAVEIGRELLEKRKLAESNAEYKEYQSVQTDRKEKEEAVTVLLQPKQPSVTERLDEVILKVLEEQMGLATLQGKTMQTAGGPMKTAELLHRIRRDVLEQAVESKVSDVRIHQESQRESQIYRLIWGEIQKLKEEETTEIARKQLLYQIRERCLEEMAQGQMVQRQMVQRQTVQRQTVQRQTIQGQINSQSLTQETAGNTQVFRVLKLLRGTEMPVGESISEEQTEAPRQVLTDVNRGASETVDIVKWQQLAEQPEIRELIESREIRVPEKLKETAVRPQETTVRLNHYQNPVEKIEQLRVEQQEQFQKLMERAALQEEQIVRIENWNRELKERLQEQEEKQETGNRDEIILQKLQEQLRIERLRRGLI